MPHSILVRGCGRVCAGVSWGCVVPGYISDDDAILFLGYHVARSTTTAAGRWREDDGDRRQHGDGKGQQGDRWYDDGDG